MDFTMQEIFAGVGIEGQKKLRDKTVTIVGLGGVGSTVCQILARNGVNLRLIDKGRIIERDLPRQTLYGLNDITKFKAKQVKKILEGINNDVTIKTFHEDLIKNNIFLIESDLIVDATNDFKTSEIINEYAISKKIPLIFSNYAGEKGHILIVDKIQNKNCACVSCLKKQLEFKPLDEVGIYSPITHIIASFVANSVLKNLLGVPNVTKLLSIDILKTEVRHSVIEKDKKCKFC